MTLNFYFARAKQIFPWTTKIQMYEALVGAILNYNTIPLSGAMKSDLSKVFITQKKIIRNICNADSKAHTAPLFENCDILPLNEHIKYNLILTSFKILYNKCPQSINSIVRPKRNNKHLRSSNENLAHIPTTKSNKGDNLAPMVLPKIWNEMPYFIKEELSLKALKPTLKAFLQLKSNP